MYTCQLCRRAILANVKSQRVVVETRVREYPFRKNVNRVKKDGKVYYTHDKGGVGREIVREVIACPECAAVHRQTHPG